MKIGRAINVLTAAREQAAQMAAMYRDEVIPRDAAALASAQNQLAEFEANMLIRLTHTNAEGH